MRHCCLIALMTALGAAAASSETTVLSKDTRFCPSWAEAHERTLASLNNGRPPYPVKWQGCMVLKQGRRIDVVAHHEDSTEIVLRGKHWFADERRQGRMRETNVETAWRTTARPPFRRLLPFIAWMRRLQLDRYHPGPAMTPA
jgi:hypothetical protein